MEGFDRTYFLKCLRKSIYVKNQWFVTGKVLSEVTENSQQIFDPHASHSVKPRETENECSVSTVWKMQ